MHDPVAPSPDAIAVVGLAGRFPGADNIAELWRNLCAGVESITFFSAEELIAAGVDPKLARAANYIKARGVLGDPALFDAAFFGLNPREAALMDPQHRLFLECAWEALENAGYSTARQPGRVGVFGGQSMNTYLLTNVYPHLTHVASAESLQAAIGNDKDSLTTEVAYRLNLTGPAVTIQSSSSTSLVAIHCASQSLLAYECDLALAGGVSIHFPEKAGYLYHEGGTTSPDGHCRTFDARAAGFVSGHGAGVVVLRRLSDALASGDTIYAVLKGSAVNNDGSAKVSYMAPSLDGQAEVIALAQAVAGVAPDTIRLMEAHGTATLLGDPIEVAALTRAFRHGTLATGFCALGSIKSNIGHLDAAAGVAGFIKAVLALYHKKLPPSLHYERPNPQIDFASSPFYVNTRLADWPAEKTPRRAGVTSLGMGGTNAHCVLQEAPHQKSGVPSRRRSELLLLSARSDAALDTLSGALAAHLHTRPEVPLADVSYTLALGRTRHRQRRMLLAQGTEDAAAALAGHESSRLLSGTAVSSGRPVMFMFSGQGAQYVAMGQHLYETELVFRAELDRCAERLTGLLGRDLRAVLYPPADGRAEAEAALQQTALTQPALFAIEYALARQWMSWGITPRAMIGHSLGEYVAACLAGVFTLEDALALVAARGRLMQQQPPGAMLAVPLSEATLMPLLGAELAVASSNGPASSVVAGPIAAIDALAERLAASGCATTRLHTSHAFHSAMMEPILDTFQDVVRRVVRRPPTIPYLSNVTGTWITSAEATSPEYWARHLRQTVRFASGIGELLADADAILLEVGPGQTLATLARQHPIKQAGQLVLSSLRHPRELQLDGDFLLTTLGRLWLAGIEPDWDAFFGMGRCRVALPTYPFERQRHWVAPKASTAESPAAVHKLDVGDWLYLPSWKPALAPRPRSGEPKRGEWWILTPNLDSDSDSDLGTSLIRRLMAAGESVVRVQPGQALSQLDAHRWSINPASPEDYVGLVRRLIADGRTPAKIVHLWNARVGEPPSLATALERGVFSLLHLARSLGQVPSELSLTVITYQMQGLFGELPCPELATLLGPCRVIPQEYPHIACKAVDLVSAPTADWHARALVDQVIAECEAAFGDETVVAWRGRQRWVQGFEPIFSTRIPVDAERPPLRDQGTYLVIGGLGNLGYVHAQLLAARPRARLVLVGRSELPPRTEWEAQLASPLAGGLLSRRISKLRALERVAEEVMYLPADVTDPVQLAAALQQATARLGPIHGMVFAAGTVDQTLFRSISDTTQAAAESFLRTRLLGLTACADALCGQPLDFCLIASSLASVLGGLGLFSYAAATHFMDAFAVRRNCTSSSPWLSVNWDAWQFDAEVPLPAGAAKPLGERAITATEGARALAHLLAVGTPGQVVVSTSPLQDRIALWTHARQAAPQRGAGSATADVLAEHSPRPALQNPYVAPQDDQEAAIARIWEQALGLSPVGVHDNFFDLGGNSLVGVQLIERLRERLGAAIPTVALYETPTVRAFTKWLGGSAAVAPPAESASTKDAADWERGERRRARRQRRSTLGQDPADPNPDEDL